MIPSSCPKMPNISKRHYCGSSARGCFQCKRYPFSSLLLIGEHNPESVLWDADFGRTNIGKCKDPIPDRGSPSERISIRQLPRHILRILHSIRSPIQPRSQKMLSTSMARDADLLLGSDCHVDGVCQIVHWFIGRSSVSRNGRRWIVTGEAFTSR